MIQSFNRVEHKYVLRVSDFDRIRNAVGARLEPDANGRQGAYRVVSLYYDSPAHDFFWAKVDGQDHRRKVRLRIYPGVAEERAASPRTQLATLEVKQRHGKRVHKRRLALPLPEAVQLCEGGDPPDGLSSFEADVAREVVGLARAMDLRPTAITDYHRCALEGRDADAGLRITFDTQIGCRVHQLELTAEADSREILASDWGVLELKATAGIPAWLTAILKQHDARRQRISKYCTGLALLEHPGALERAVGAEVARHECFRPSDGSPSFLQR